MNTTRILGFLNDVAANNNRDWFQEHKLEYETVKRDFDQGVGAAIKALSNFDDEISHVQVKDCTYRFYRDIRFSPDKSPYKRHFGAYICAKGRKALRGGYYIHVQPGNCLVAIGSYWLPTNILTSCRNELIANIEDWRKIVESGKFISTFGYANEGCWEDRMKDYCCWLKVPDNFFEGGKWETKFIDICKTGKPMMDFMNNVIDDYE